MGVVACAARRAFSRRRGIVLRRAVVRFARLIGVQLPRPSTWLRSRFKGSVTFPLACLLAFNARNRTP